MHSSVAISVLDRPEATKVSTSRSRSVMPVNSRRPQASEGAAVTPYDEETLKVTGVSADRIGELAHEHRFLLRELATGHASLEAAFMELTADSVEFLAG